MSPQALARLESTNATMRALAQPAWRALYGPHPPHRRLQHTHSYKTLFVEREMLRHAGGAPYLQSPEIAPDTYVAYHCLLERFYDLSPDAFEMSPASFIHRLVTETDTDLVLGVRTSRAAEVFLALSHTDHMGGSAAYQEAVAIALMASRRMDEAAAFRPVPGAMPAELKPHHFMHLARFSREALWPHLSWRDADSITRAQALVVAAAAGHIRELEAILTYDTDPHVSYLGTTAARAAAANDQKDVLVLLQAHGFDLGLQPPQAEPPFDDAPFSIAPVRPIIDAVRCGSLQAAQYLLSQGVDIDLTERTHIANNDGLSAPQTAWAYAVSLDHLPMVDCLFQALPPARRSVVHGALRLAPLFEFVSQSMVSPDAGERVLRRLIVALGIDVNAQDARGRTALHHAAEKGLLPLAQALLAQGACALPADDSNICTPLELAESGRHETVAALIASAWGLQRTPDFWRTKVALLSHIFTPQKQEICQAVAGMLFPADVGLAADTSEQTLLEFVTHQYDALHMHQYLIEAAMPIWSLQSIQKQHGWPTSLPAEQQTAGVFATAIETLFSQRAAGARGDIAAPEPPTPYAHRIRRLALTLYPDLELGPDDLQQLSELVRISIPGPALLALETHVASDAFARYVANQRVFDQALGSVLERFRWQLIDPV